MSLLAAEVRAVLQRLRLEGPSAMEADVDRAIGRLDEPLRVAVAGRVKVGKSTLLNALIGEPLAATDAAECTRYVTWYTRNEQYRAEAVDVDGSRTQLVLDRSGDAAEIQLGGVDGERVARLEVGAPAPSLTDVVLIDTPGIDSATEGLSDRTAGFVAPGSGDQGADVLVFLLRHLHTADSEFLEAFADPTAPWVDPVRSVAVLSRADELGSGRGDGLVLAGLVADRYRNDPQLRRVVSEVFPISGLLAVFAATVNQPEFDVLRAVASLPDAELDLLLASAARLQGRSDRLGVTAADRRRLLRRLGLAGVRLAVVALRSGTVTTADELAMLMAELSGIAPLRRMLLERFASRADTLKAARGLDVAESLIERLPEAVAGELRRDVQQLRLNAHEFRELDTLRHLLDRPEDEVAGQPVPDLLRLLGHAGGSLAARLDVEDDMSSVDLRPLAVDRVDRLRGAAMAGYASRADGEILMAAATSLEVALHALAARDADERPPGER